MSRAAAVTMTLIRAAAGGDDDAFHTLVARVLPDLRRWALARTGDPVDADDVVQGTLIRMHRGLAGFDGRSRFTTWLYRVMRTAAADLYRSRSASADLVDAGLAGDRAAVEPDPIRVVESERLAGEVRDCFTRLPPRQREVLELVDHEGLTAVEAAAMLDMKPVTVRANLFKARRAVREAILVRHPELMEGYET